MGCKKSHLKSTFNDGAGSGRGMGSDEAVGQENEGANLSSMGKSGLQVLPDPARAAFGCPPSALQSVDLLIRNLVYVCKTTSDLNQHGAQLNGSSTRLQNPKKTTHVPECSQKSNQSGRVFLEPVELKSIQNGSKIDAK